MEIKNVFLILGICLAAMAVIVTFVGLRNENFPSRRTMLGLLGVAVLLVLGTTTFAVKLSIEEQEEREHHSKEVIGEEASIAPLDLSSVA